jgi:hypothetical protein
MAPVEQLYGPPYICGGVKEFRFSILEAKFGAKSVPSFWQQVDGILPRYHINVHPILGACTLYTGVILHTRGQNLWQKVYPPLAKI